MREHLSSWAAKKKIRYTIGFFLVIALLAGYPLFVILNATFNKPASCFDGKQNQDERGVDCGGGCDRPCVGETRDLSVVWSKALPIGDGYYDIAAKIDNPNPQARLASFSYTMKVFDANDTVIYEKSGTDRAAAGERFIVFEPKVYLGDVPPARVSFEIATPLDWLQEKVTTLSVKTGKKELTHSESTSRLDVSIENTDFVGEYEDLDIAAVVSDITGRPVGVSKTYVESLPAREERTVFFTWPVSLKEQTKGLCDSRSSLPLELLVPMDVVLVSDRSGSMNDDGGDPPQPISDAKNAAKVFVDQMLSVDRTALISFATEASSPIDHGLTADTESLDESVDTMTIGVPDNQQHTNIGDGIKQALDELQKNGREKAKKAIILLTDGVATRPLDPISGASSEAYAEQYAAIQAAQAKKQDIFLYVIGLGSGINEQFLTYQVASSPERFYKARTSEELAAIYKDIAQAVCEEDVFLYEVFIRVPDDA